MPSYDECVPKYHNTRHISANSMMCHSVSWSALYLEGFSCWTKNSHVTLQRPDTHQQGVTPLAKPLHVNPWHIEMLPSCQHQAHYELLVCSTRIVEIKWIWWFRKNNITSHTRIIVIMTHYDHTVLMVADNAPHFADYGHRWGPKGFMWLWV